MNFWAEWAFLNPYPSNPPTIILSLKSPYEPVYFPSAIFSPSEPFKHRTQWTLCSPLSLFGSNEPFWAQPFQPNVSDSISPTIILNLISSFGPNELIWALWAQFS